THKAGAVDDSAAELFAAAKQIDASSEITAIVAGYGPELDNACAALRVAYPSVWRISSEAIAHPNAELIRQALLKILPPGAVVLLAHEHFGIDLAPGLSIKLN